MRVDYWPETYSLSKNYTNVSGTWDSLEIETLTEDEGLWTILFVATADMTLWRPSSSSLSLWSLRVYIKITTENSFFLYSITLFDSNESHTWTFVITG